MKELIIVILFVICCYALLKILLLIPGSIYDYFVSRSAKKERLKQLVANKKREKELEAQIEANRPKLNAARKKLEGILDFIDTKKKLVGKNSCSNCGAPVKNINCEYCNSYNA